MNIQRLPLQCPRRMSPPAEPVIVKVNGTVRIEREDRENRAALCNSQWIERWGCGWAWPAGTSR